MRWRALYGVELVVASVLVFWCGSGGGIPQVLRATVVCAFEPAMAEDGQLAAMRLALESRAAAHQYPQRSLLLAVEAVEQARLSGAVPVPVREALLSALRNTGGRVLTFPGQTTTGDAAASAEGAMGSERAPASRSWRADAGRSDEAGASPPLHPARQAFFAQDGELPTRQPLPRLDMIATDGGGRRVAAASSEQHFDMMNTSVGPSSVYLWDLEDSGRDGDPTTLTIEGSEVSSLAISRDGAWLVVGAADGRARLWRLTEPRLEAPAFLLLADGSMEQSQTPPTGASATDDSAAVVRMTGVAFSSDGRFLALAGDNGQLHLWSLSASGPLRCVSLFSEPIPLARPILLFSDDGRWLTVANADPGGGLFSGLGEALGAVFGAIFGAEDSAEARARREAEQARLYEAGRHVHLFRLDSPDVAASRTSVRVGDEPVAHVAWDAAASCLAACTTSGHIGVWAVNEGGLGQRLVHLEHTGQVFLAGVSVQGLAVDPSGEWLVSAGLHDTRLWHLRSDPSPNHPTVSMGHLAATDRLAMDPRGAWLAMGSSSSADIRLVDFASLKALHDGQHEWIVLEPNTGVYEGEQDIGVVLPTASGHATEQWLRGHEHPLLTLIATPDGRHLVSSSSDGTIRLWNAHRASCCAQPEGFGFPSPFIEPAITADNLAVSASLQSLATFERDVRGPEAMGGTLSIWPFPLADRHHPLASFPVPQPPVALGGISGNRRWAVTQDFDGNTQLWQISPASGTATAHLLAEPAGVGIAVFSPDSRWLATAKGVHLHVLEDHDESLAADAPQSVRRVVDPRVRLWNLTGDAPDQQGLALVGHTRDLSALLISGDSRWLVTVAAEDQRMQLNGEELEVDSSSGNVICLWPLTASPIPSSPQVLISNQEVGAVGISPGQRFLYACDLEGGVHLWDLTSNDPAKVHVLLQGHVLPVKAVAFGRDDTLLASGSGADNPFASNDQRGTVRVWDLKAQSPEAASVALGGHRGAVESLAVSPDGRWVVSVDVRHDGPHKMTDLRLWDLQTDTPDRAGQRLTAHDDTICRLAISPDSRWLVTIGDAAVPVVLWDLRSPDPDQSAVTLMDRRIPADVMAVTVRFGPDSRSLHVLGADGVRSWSLDLDDQLALARRTAGRRWTERERRRYAIPDNAD